MAHSEVIRDEATAWAVRTGDPRFDDWDSFTAWLEEDPAHAAAYDEVAAGVAEAADLLAADLPAADESALKPLTPNTPVVPLVGNDDELTPDVSAAPSRRRFLAGGIAAAAALLGAIGAWQLSAGPTVIETAPGEVRLVALEGGGQITVGGGSRLVVDPDEPRLASLERGRALFTIRHDPGSPFRLKVGEDTLVDVGTVFDVQLTDERMTVAVSEGAVMFNPEGADVRVGPGEVLTSPVDSDAWEIASIPLAEVGEWQEGRLTFRDATLAQVTADLSRATGTRFTVAPQAAGRTVSGSLLLDSVEADPRTVGPLLDVSVRREGEAWELGSP